MFCPNCGVRSLNETFKGWEVRGEICNTGHLEAGVYFEDVVSDDDDDVLFDGYAYDQDITLRVCPSCGFQFAIE